MPFPLARVMAGPWFFPRKPRLPPATETLSASTTETTDENAPELLLFGDEELTLPDNSGIFLRSYLVSNTSGHTTKAFRLIHVIDTTPPELELLGDMEMILSPEEPFTEPGYLAQDSLEGDLSSQVTVETIPLPIPSAIPSAIRLASTALSP